MMRRPVILLAFTLAGCAHTSPDTNTHYYREVALTGGGPEDRRLAIKLLRVEPDGRAVIYASHTRERIVAAPGEPFLGRRGGRYNVRTFGEKGLILKSSDPATQTAVLGHYWAG